MVTMAQRIEKLRTERNISRPALASALGMPRTSIEKFETGRATPTQEQLKKLADYFEVTVIYLKNGDDSMSTWMEGAYMDEPTPSQPRPRPRPKPVQTASTGADGSMMDALLSGKKFQEALREAALEVLRSPEGQEILANVVRRELAKNGR